jgi:hypothetical protein
MSSHLLQGHYDGVVRKRGEYEVCDEEGLGMWLEG